MGLFKNGVGRPSNETLKKRRIIYLVIILAAVLGIGTCVFYTVNYFGSTSGADKNVSTSKLYNDISIKNNSGAIYGDNNKTNKGNFKKVSSKKLEIELSSSNKASITIRTTYNKDIIKGKSSGLKKYYYQVQIASYDKYDREISKSKKIDIKKTSIDQTITTGTTVAYLKVKFYDATKNHEELTSSRIMIPVEAKPINNMKKNFPDERLRQCVLDYYNKWYKASKTDLADSELSKIKGNEPYSELIIPYLSCTNVSDLTGLEKLTNLQTFQLRDPKLTTANFGKNKKLKCIEIVGNIKKIDVTQNTELEILYVGPYLIGQTGLTSINVTKNKKLKELWLTHNSLKQINLSQNTNLEILDLEYNKLSSLDLSKNTKLKKLYVLEGNSIKKSNIKVAKNVKLNNILKD